MIKSKKDYKEYISEDMKAIYNGEGSPSLRIKLGCNRVHFQLLLRKAEYYTNCCKIKIIGTFHRWRYRRIARKCGFTIPLNVCGKGLNIAHEGTIVISDKATLGDYCRIHVGVNIGVNGSEPGAPKIGNGVYIGPGAVIFGNINIADEIAIGANSVVNKSFLEKGVTIAGVPAKVISKKGSRKLLYFPKE